MSYIKPQFRNPQLPKNAVGYAKSDYEGVISTLCAGCGHDSISAAIVQACFELDVEPHRIAKLSGIGCSSKSPNYFLNNSHGFNSVHGRMPSVATGANLANRELLYLGISGDGDTASIGMGQFVHAIRRNLNMTYIVMNNGCYGLTKGQDSATADAGSINKSGVVNPFDGIDLAGLALELGAAFVARSFSGDKSQLIPLIKAAMSHQGFAFIDVISPCVTFNNDPESNKSYDYGKDKEAPLHDIAFIQQFDEISVDYEPGAVQEVKMHDGPTILLRKLEESYDPTNRLAALSRLEEARAQQEFITGLLYFDEARPTLAELENIVDTPLALLTEDRVRPSKESLQKLMKDFM